MDPKTEQIPTKRANASSEAPKFVKMPWSRLETRDEPKPVEEQD
jgi:hypothetical protein